MRYIGKQQKNLRRNFMKLKKTKVAPIAIMIALIAGNGGVSTAYAAEQQE